jgi:hypothetical protein
MAMIFVEYLRKLHCTEHKGDNAEKNAHCPANNFVSFLSTPNVGRLANPLHIEMV